ncbi:MAG TPA: ABC-type transport auxiliary lipoprotein family protein [Rhodanobacteraceae bacterium]|nr:ABC-type transport auxiliary lipoprotein family protein [Rhodanobacteraceae bacterium]
MTVPRTFCVARTLAIACATAALLAGCSVLPKNSPVQVWQPQVSDTLATGAVAGDFSLRVDTPNTTGELDQAGIVVMPEPGQVSTYTGARWSDSPAVLVRQRLVDAFMAAKLPAVTTDDDHFASDYTLSGDLRAFQSEYRGGSPVVVVRFDAQLRRGGARNLLATRSFVVTQDPSGVDVPQIVAAFGAADDQLAQQVVAWTIDIVRRDRAVHPTDAKDPQSRSSRSR